MFTSDAKTKKRPGKIMFNGRHCERRPLVYFNSRCSQRRPLNLLKVVVHNDGYCQPIPKRTSFNIILKLDLYFGFFFSKYTISVQNSVIYHLSIPMIDCRIKKYFTRRTTKIVFLEKK